MNSLCVFSVGLCLLFTGILMGYNLVHVLNYLILLEMLVLLSFWYGASYLNLGQYSGIILMSFLVLVVASASLGLSILVSICRSHGQDYFNTYNLLF